MPRRFVVKKEIRSLGIDVCNSRRVIGAVVRGGLYLDGIVIFSPKPNQWDASIGHSVVRTRYYPELKLIMTHDPERKLDAGKIETITRLPVMEVHAVVRENDPGSFGRFSVQKKMLRVRSSLEPRFIQEVLETTWAVGSLPEPLRVAHLISNSRFLGKNRLFLG